MGFPYLSYTIYKYLIYYHIGSFEIVLLFIVQDVNISKCLFDRSL
jgi:hypothetical protein